MSTVRRVLTSCGVIALGLCLGALSAAARQAPPAPATQVAPEDQQLRDTFVRVCVKCHTEDRVIAEGRSLIQWEYTIIAMQS
jgi:hypothetical protein